MRIAQVPHSFLPNLGGIQNYVCRLSRDLANENFQVEVLTTDININKTAIHRTNKNYNFQVKYFHSYLTILGNPFPLGLIPHLMKNEYDIIHVHSIQAIPSLLSAILKRKAKLIVTAHGISPDDGRLLVRIIWNIYKPFSKFICKKSDKIIVLGSKEKEKAMDLLGIDESKIEVIPNGIEIEDMPSKKSITDFKNRFDLDGCQIILFIGRVSPTKNPEILIKAFNDIHRCINNSKLIFVGPILDSYRYRLNALAKELGINRFIVFTGEINREEVLSAYCCSDIFISLGGWEGLPTTMLEAMSYGLPCLMFNSGGITDAIKDNETGLVVDELDCRKIAERIHDLLNNLTLRERIGQNAKKVVLEKYRWEIVFRQINKVYQEVFNE